MQDNAIGTYVRAREQDLCGGFVEPVAAARVAVLVAADERRVRDLELAEVAHAAARELGSQPTAASNPFSPCGFLFMVPALFPVVMSVNASAFA